MVEGRKNSIKEDELLCSMYINVGKDPIVGRNQPIGACWEHVFSITMTTR
jgi:hypothetical protein